MQEDRIRSELQPGQESDLRIRIHNTDIIASHLVLLALTDTTHEYSKLRDHVYNSLQIRYGSGITEKQGPSERKKCNSCTGETE